MVDNNYFPLEYHLLKYFIETTSDFSQKFIEINKKDLANYFGTNIRSINRLLKQFITDRMIRIEGNKLELIDSEEINRRIKKFF